MSDRPATMDVLRNGRPDSEIERYGGSTSYSFPKPLRRIACADGFDFSVQAGELLYSHPRENRGPWTNVEVGFPSERPEPWAEWEPYCEEVEEPTRTVYSYVPLPMVEALIALHGGEA